jgi:hypothetical protein
MSACLLCDRDLAEDEASRVACRACQVRLSTHLRELPGLYRLLGIVLRPSGGTDGPRVSGTRAVSLPVNEGALELRAWGGMVTALEVHEEDWRRVLGLGAMARFRGTAEQALMATVEFLGQHLWWACERYGDIDGFADDLRQLRSAVLSVVDPTPASERARRLGYCPAPLDGGPCGAVVTLRSGAAIATCRWCRADYPPETWLDLAAALIQEAS